MTLEKPAHKAEYPPLLPEGFYPYSPEEVKELCVDRFPTSTVRSEIMAGLMIVLERIGAINMTCTVWLDGSFTTRKVEPDDVDFIVIAPSIYRDEGTPEQQDLIEWLINNEDEPKKLFHCHTDVVLEFPEGSTFDLLTNETKAHFQSFYGFSVTTKEPKGIIVLTFSETLPLQEPEEESLLEIEEGSGE